MLSNYHTLGYVASSLHETLRSRRISQVFTQNPDELAIKFEPEAPHLIFSCQADANAAYLHDRFARARSSSADLLSDATGRTVVAVRLQPGDRVIALELSTGSRLLLQFFGAKANALLVDTEARVIDAFRHPRSLIGTRVEERTADVLYDIAGLPALLQASGVSPLTSVLRSAMPTLGTTLTRELLHRASLSPMVQASALDSAQTAVLTDELQTLLAELNAPRYRVYFDRGGNPALFSLIPLRHMEEATEREFDDLHAAIRFFVGRRRAAAEVGGQLASLRTSLHQRRDRIERTLRAMEEDARESERADEYEQWGHTLLAHLDRVQKGDALFVLDGTRIPLDRALPPARNAQRFFEKAKRARAAAEEKSARIGPARERLTAASTLLDRLDAVTSADDFHRFQQENAAALDLFGLSEKAKKRAEIPFRVFTVDGQFEVWVGKSSANNDLLTLHHAKPNDLWFHARGSSGSHVILKTATGKGIPGKRAKEQAAAIAAYFSKMRTASTVPVAMTERKYVRKPKGAPPGSVVLERERVLFVTPALPAGSS